MATISGIKSNVEKLYGQLSPNQQAGLVFSALANLDEAKAASIETCIEWHTYRSIDAQYRTQLTKLVNFGATYAFYHWRLRAITPQACCMDEPSEDIGMEAMARLQSLEIAVSELCAANNIEFADIKRMAANEGFKASPELTDTSLIDEYREIFGRVIS